MRLRTSAVKRFKRGEAATPMIWRLALVAEKIFRALKTPELCGTINHRALFRDGVRMIVAISTRGVNRQKDLKRGRRGAAA